LAALLHGTLVMGVSQTLWRWTEGATHLYSAGRPSRWELAHISNGECSALLSGISCCVLLCTSW